MKLRPTALLILFLALAAPAGAQQSVRIGYVDMKEVLDNAPQVIAGREKLDREFRPRNDALEAEEARVLALEQRLADGDLPEEERISLERRARELRRGLTREREDLRDELSFRRTEEVQRLEDQINVAVQEIARQYGYDLVISSPVVYASDTLDITDLILEQLQAEFEADERESELP